MLHGNAVSRREEHEANSVLTTPDLRRVLVIARETGSAEPPRSAKNAAVAAVGQPYREAFGIRAGVFSLRVGARGQ